MKIGERVYCYNVKNGKEEIHFSSKDIKVGEIYTITDIRKRSDIYSKYTQVLTKYDYVVLDTVSFPIREKRGKKKDDGVPIAYFDKFFINLKEYRKQKLKKLNSI